MQKVILIHGNGSATGDDNWFPYLKGELEKMGVVCLAPNFPDPVTAKAKIWLPFLENLNPDEDTVLIGHSTGAIVAMRWAETHKIRGSVLVGAYYTDLGYEDEKESGYFDTPWNWEAIKRNQKWIVQFASDDDPYISAEESHFVRDHLSTDYHELSGQGHFGEGGDKIKLDFSELLEVLKQKLGI